MVSTMDSLLGGRKPFFSSFFSFPYFFLAGGNHADIDCHGGDATCMSADRQKYKKKPKLEMKFSKCLSASNLGGNPYYNYLISAAVEIPGKDRKETGNFQSNPVNKARRF